MLTLAGIFLAVQVFAQGARLAPPADLSTVGIQNLQFTAKVPKDQVFVIELRIKKDDIPIYTGWLYSTQKSTKIDIPIFQSQIFFQPENENRIVIKTPFKAFQHRNAMIEGQLGGKDFTFSITEFSHSSSKPAVYSYSFLSYLTSYSKASIEEGKLSSEAIYLRSQNEPNKALEPMPTAVTPPAAQESRQP